MRPHSRSWSSCTRRSRAAPPTQPPGKYAAMVAFEDVEAAAERIRPFVVRTPLERSTALSARCGVEVWLKFECFQTTGSFKLRGALNALMLLPTWEGVVTA